jgi:hypothetical protein
MSQVTPILNIYSEQHITNGNKKKYSQYMAKEIVETTFYCKDSIIIFANTCNGGM